MMYRNTEQSFICQFAYVGKLDEPAFKFEGQEYFDVIRSKITQVVISLAQHRSKVTGDNLFHRPSKIYQKIFSIILKHSNTVV